MDKVKEEMGLPMIQKTLLIWDAFRSQQSQLITNTLDYYNIVTVIVPNNLLQPLDLTTNSINTTVRSKRWKELPSIIISPTQ